MDKLTHPATRSAVAMLRLPFAGQSGRAPRTRGQVLDGMINARAKHVCLFSAAIVSGLVWGSVAEAQTAQLAPGGGAFKATYDLSLVGVGIGASSLGVTIDKGGAYAVDMHAKLTGLAGVLVSGKGGARATGVVSNSRVLPSTLAVVASTASDKRTLRMSFAGGSVTAIEIQPPLEDWNRPDRVAVVAGHRQAVIDPLSALLMPTTGKNLADACNRTIPIFDGATRFDVALRYTGATTISHAGYTGPAATCSARYTPISGHRPLRTMTRFMTDNTDMGVTLIPIGDTGIYAPFRIHVRTTLGLAVLQANKIFIDGRTSVASGKRKKSGESD